MPFCWRPGLHIYYEHHDSLAGEGAPCCLLVPGLSANSQTFPYLVEFLRVTHRVVVIDPRGMGRTEPNRGRWGLAELADDAAAVLAELEIAQADVIGISMGGMIAQELAISYPHLVRRLVLCCTHPGVPPGVRPRRLPLLRFALGLVRLRLTGNLERFAVHDSAMLLGPDTPPERKIAFWRHRRATTVMTPRGLLSQIAAVRRFRSFERLAGVRSPTLILAGDSDVLVPPANAAILAGAIAGSRVEVLHGGHVFYYEDIARFRQIVGAFLEG